MQRTDMWNRWKAGQSLHQIGRAFGKSHVSIQFCHWEGDLLGGARNSHIAALVERHSRFTALVKVPSKDTAACGGRAEPASS